MKPHLYNFAAIICITIAATTATGCRENTLINSRVSPTNNRDSVYSVTLPCITHTYYDDSAITSVNIGGIPMFQGVGAMVDPFFGTMTSSTFFQVIPQTPDTGVYTGNTIDSAVLVLPYSGFTYGSTATDSLATYQVFYMADTMNFFNTYYSFSDKPIDVSFPLSAPTTINISHLGDSMLVSGPDHSALHIKLNVEVLMSHISPALLAIAESGNPQAFLNAFNGICVRAADTRKLHSSIPYFQLDGVDNYSEAGILVYYHPSGTTVSTDNIEAYSFNTGFCSHFNNITRSYSHYPVNTLLHSTQPNDPVVAMQNQPGAGIDVIITGIKSLPAGIINKAQIQFSVLPQYTDTSAYIWPESLLPLGIASATYQPLGTTYAGEPYSVYDSYPLGSIAALAAINDGEYPVSHNGSTATNTYIIDIPREVIASKAVNNDTLHYHINGTQDYYGAFHLVAGGGSYGANGTSDTIYRAKFIVVYSKYTSN